MKKLIISGLVLGIAMVSVSAAHADPLTSWVLSLFGIGSDDSGPTNGPTPDDGGGTGTGIDE